MDNRTTVIIADNSEEFCSSLSAALQRSDGFQVLGTANDGEQAIRMVSERKPDVLVLDLMLAKQDGISVLKNISTMERRPVVFATSGFVTDYVASAAAGLGVRYLMLKPCDLSALVERMEEELGSKATVVATGGIARFIIPMCRTPIIYDKDLLLKGLAILYRENARN